MTCISHEHLAMSLVLVFVLEYVPKSIAVHGQRLWDSIPIAIQNSTGFGLFKRKAQDYYVNSYTCTDISTDT